MVRGPIRRAVGLAMFALLTLVASRVLAAEELVINLAGDVAYPTGWSSLDRVDAAGAKLFDSVRPVLDAADLNVANLECPVTERRPEASRLFPMACRPDRLAYALDAGINVWSLANNHAADAGHPGIADTHRHLTALAKRRPFWFAGIDPSRRDPLAPVTIALPGKPTVAFFAVSAFAMGHVVASADDPKLPARITAAKRTHDLVIVSVHAGVEYAPLVHEDVAARHRAFVDAGADIVAGHHAHIAQGVERYRGKVIFHGLGNLSFASRPLHRKPRHRTQPPLMLSLIGQVHVIGDRLKRVTLHPIYVGNDRPWRLGPDQLPARFATPQLLTGPFAQAAHRILRNRSTRLPPTPQNTTSPALGSLH